MVSSADNLLFPLTSCVRVGVWIYFKTNIGWLRLVCGDMKVFDIGAHTIVSFEEIIKHSKTVIWNGPVGCFERQEFQEGTKRILEYLAELDNVQTIIGGGDTLGAIKKFEVDTSKFTHISTGGGAMLEFLEGKVLPGIEIVQ